jgi:hypothetical protein
VPTVGVQATVPGALLGLVWGLDGTRALGDVLDGLPGEDGLPVARRLLERGLLEAVG